jgi:hypothetical protein
MWSIAPAQAVLVLDGVFLTSGQATEVLDVFDLPRHTVSRSVLCGWEPVMTYPLTRGILPRVARYVRAQRINMAWRNPASRASLVIDNTGLPLTGR